MFKKNIFVAIALCASSITTFGIIKRTPTENTDETTLFERLKANAESLQKDLNNALAPKNVCKESLDQLKESLDQLKEKVKKLKALLKEKEEIITERNATIKELNATMNIQQSNNNNTIASLKTALAQCEKHTHKK